MREERLRTIQLKRFLSLETLESRITPVLGQAAIDGAYPLPSEWLRKGGYEKGTGADMCLFSNQGKIRGLVMPATFSTLQGK